MPARCLVRCAVMVLGVATPVAAQTTSASLPPPLPRVEFGGMVMAATSLPGEAFNSIRAGGVVVGVPLTHRHGLELALLASDLDARNLRGLYQVDYRYTFGAPASAARPFVHAGFAGGFSYNKYPEQRLVRPDQSAVVYPGFRQASLNAPQVASFGGGIGYRVKRVSFVTQGTFLCFNGCLVLAAVGARFGIGER